MDSSGSWYSPPGRKANGEFQTTNAKADVVESIAPEAEMPAFMAAHFMSAQGMFASA